MGTLVPSILPGSVSFNSHNHPGAFKEAGAQRGPGHIADLGDYSNSGLSPKPSHAFLILMTKTPNERTKDIGHHHMNAGQEAPYQCVALCARPVAAYVTEDSQPLRPEVTFTSGGKQTSTSCRCSPVSSSLKGRRFWQSRLRARPHHASRQRLLHERKPLRPSSPAVETPAFHSFLKTNPTPNLESSVRAAISFKKHA